MSCSTTEIPRNVVLAEGGWEKWHDWESRQLANIAEWICQAIEATPGKRVLDAACGTGLPAIDIARRVWPQGAVVAVDVSPVMAAACRRKVEAAGLGNVEVLTMDLARLELPDASFDAVSCKDGLIYCPDPVAAAAELGRVLRPGGRCAITAWDEPARCPFFTTLFPIVARFLGLEPKPGAPGPFRLSAPGELESVLVAAGFREVVVERQPAVWDFDSIAMHWEVIADKAAPIQLAVSRLAPADLDRLKQAIADALAPYVVEGGRVRIHNSALCASATR